MTLYQTEKKCTLYSRQKPSTNLGEKMKVITKGWIENEKKNFKPDYSWIGCRGVWFEALRRNELKVSDRIGLKELLLSYGANQDALNGDGKSFPTKLTSLTNFLKAHCTKLEGVWYSHDLIFVTFKGDSEVLVFQTNSGGNFILSEVKKATLPQVLASIITKWEDHLEGWQEARVFLCELAEKTL